MLLAHAVEDLKWVPVNVARDVKKFKAGDPYRTAVKDCVQWLHSRAAAMNDGRATAILDSAAFNLGSEAKARGHIDGRHGGMPPPLVANDVARMTDSGEAP